MKSILTAALLCTISFSPASGQSLKPITELCEIAVALSALPSQLRADASVYALVDGDYREVRTGSGPFTCIVERNHPAALIPQCMDEAGREAVLPALIFKSKRILEGASVEEVEAEFERKAEQGEFRPPARPGVSYMISDFNYIYIGRTNQIMKVRPHVMFYGPNLTNRDIGGSFQAAMENRGLPFVIGLSIHRNIISHVDKASDSAEVAAACKGQLGDPPPLFGL